MSNAPLLYPLSASSSQLPTFLSPFHSLPFPLLSFLSFSTPIRLFSLFLSIPSFPLFPSSHSCHLLSSLRSFLSSSRLISLLVSSPSSPSFLNSLLSTPSFFPPLHFFPPSYLCFPSFFLFHLSFLSSFLCWSSHPLPLPSFLLSSSLLLPLLHIFPNSLSPSLHLTAALTQLHRDRKLEDLLPNAFKGSSAGTCICYSLHLGLYREAANALILAPVNWRRRQLHIR